MMMMVSRCVCVCVCFRFCFAFFLSFSMFAMFCQSNRTRPALLLKAAFATVLLGWKVSRFGLKPIFAAAAAIANCFCVSVFFLYLFLMIDLHKHRRSIGRRLMLLIWLLLLFGDMMHPHMWTHGHTYCSSGHTFISWSISSWRFSLLALSLIRLPLLQQQ